jgi:hypothetical protein
MSIHMYNSATLSTANTDISGQTGTLVTLLTGGNPGTIVDEIQLSAAGVTTAGAIRMYVTGPGVTTLIAEYEVQAVTPVGVDPFRPTWKQTIRPLNLKLHTGQQLKFTTHKAETFHVTAFCTIL